MVKVKFEKLCKDAITPEQATPGSAGFDLFSIEEYILYAGETIFVKTGIRVELPEGHMMYISSKGGPTKNGVFVLNSPGLVDCDFRGEIIVILHKTLSSIYKDARLVNASSFYEIKKGQKVAQFVILPYPKIQLYEGTVNINTERGEGKLGSTGIHSKKGN